MEDAPEYLLRILNVARAALFGSFAEAGSEDAVVRATAEASESLQTWTADEEFWEETRDGLGGTVAPLSLSLDELDAILDDELNIVVGIVGDRQTALSVVLELHEVDTGVDAEHARAVVARAAVEGREIVESPSGRGRAWRAARFLRRSLTLVAGGLAIAADIVSPDATGITKIASIAGGVSVITSAGSRSRR